MKVQKERKPIFALLLSIITPGLGQIYNGQLGKAIILYLVGLLLLIILSFTGLFSSFRGMIFCLAISIVIFLCILLDALHSAIKLKLITLKPYNKWYLYIIIFLIHIFVIFPLAESILIDRIALVKAYRTPSNAMEPTLLLGDHLIAGMQYYKNKMPERGDVIIFPSPEDPSKDFIKRVIGLEGEKIEIKDKSVFINDNQIEDPWSVHTDLIVLPKDASSRDNYGPVIVPKGYIFVLGDNRDNSFDSRFLGFIDTAQIKGKPLFVYWAKDKKRIGTEIK
jgi:signal peptidase I